MRLLYLTGEIPQPHDEQQDLARRIYVLGKTAKHQFVAALIEKATFNLKDEIRGLPHSLRRLMPPFENILHLTNHAAELEAGPLGGATARALLCVVELAIVVGHFEQYPEEYTSYKSGSCLLGMGIGLLVAATVALSATVADIPRIGAEAVRLSFRFGLIVNEAVMNIEPHHQSVALESWTYAIMDVSEASVLAELEAFNSSQNVPEVAQVFVCNVRTNCVSVSGPPSRLRYLFSKSKFFQSSNHICMPIYEGPCHAESIFGVHQVEQILDGLELEHAQIPHSTILSSVTGRSYLVTSGRELFKEIIGEILVKTVRWETAVKSTIDLAKRSGTQTCQISVFKPSYPAKALLSAMELQCKDITVSLRDITTWITNPPRSDEPPRGAKEEKIAVVGMACRFPGGATDTDRFWNLLLEGRDVHRTIPADRFDVRTHYDPTGQTRNASLTPYGCFIDDPGMFDASFFNMSPREAEQTDPMHRLALVTAYEALERSGHAANGSIDPRRVGTFYGQASDDYREANSGQKIGTYFIPGGCRAFAPGRINYFFKFGGPSFSCDTACSSSLATIQIACASIWNGDADMVVAGGLNVLTNSDVFAGLSYGHFLSRTGNCKTWDSKADGYCRADGVGSVVLKRLKDAEADNDNIIALVLSAATNHSAEAVSITHPHANAQSYLYQQVIERAGIDPLDVGYVEMHGTGTQAGDSTEIKSITNVFAPSGRSRARRAEQNLHIGTVKSNIGHGEAAAGITSLIKTLCIFQQETIPPHVGIKGSLNPCFPKDLSKRGVQIPFQQVSWPRAAGKKRVAIVNNFGAAGGNTTIAMEEAPARQMCGKDPRSVYIIAISAKCKESLSNNIRRLLDHLEANPDISLCDLSYTLCARRLHHNHRVAVSISEKAQINAALAPLLSSESPYVTVPSVSPRVAFVFTGQGSLYQAMGCQLFRDFPFFRSQLVQLDRLTQKAGFPSFIFMFEEAGVSCQGELNPTISNLAIVCLEIALARLWRHLGVTPSVVIGHSLGEYAALTTAGVLSPLDTIVLVGRRCRLMESKLESGTHTMMAVRASTSAIQDIAGDLPFEIACVNGPSDTVLAGLRDQMESLRNALQYAGVHARKLEIPYAFHSTQMESIGHELEQVASSVVFKAPIISIISPSLRKVITNRDQINPQYTYRSTRDCVDFFGALRAAEQERMIDRNTTWIEIGPHAVCCKFIVSTLPSVKLAVPSLRRGENNWATLSRTLSALHLAGVPIDWREYHRPFEKALRLLDLPTYAWNDKNYWLQYKNDWNLTKGLQLSNGLQMNASHALQKSTLRTTSIHSIVEKNFAENARQLLVESDVMDSELLFAVEGHSMNGNGVVSSFIHADMAYTLSQYIHDRLEPGKPDVHLSLINFEYHEPLVAQKKSRERQPFRALISHEAPSRKMKISWYNVAADIWYASAEVEFGATVDWSRIAHLVQCRVQTLRDMAEAGSASKLSRNLAYRLFANLVDYSEAYWGMQSVILNDLEAVADVVLPTNPHGTWTYPPYFLDCLVSLSGFILNATETLDNKNNFFITPAWKSMRFAKALVHGGRYISYVKMLPTADANIFEGDVFILEGSEIIGIVEGIQFRKWPRVLLDRFFTAPDLKRGTAKTSSTEASDALPRPEKDHEQSQFSNIMSPIPSGRHAPNRSLENGMAGPQGTKVVDAAPAAADHSMEFEAVKDDTYLSNGVHPLETNAPIAQRKTADNATTSRALAIIAEETGLDSSQLSDDAQFVELGIDSLMSLVIAQRFRNQLQVEVRDSLFLEFQHIGDLKRWLASQ